MLETAAHGGRGGADHAGLSLDAAGAARRAWARLALLPLLVAGLWTLREQFVGSWPYGGFPWGRIGISQVNSPLAHLASWVGVSGLTFLIVPARAPQRSSTCASARFRDLAHGAARRRRSRCCCCSFPQFPTTAAGTLRVGARPGQRPGRLLRRRAAATPCCSAQLEATAPLLRRGHGRAAVAGGRGRLRSHRRTQSTARRPGRALGAGRRAAHRQRRHRTRRRVSSTPRCCGRRARAPSRPTTSGIPCRSASTFPTAPSSSRSRPI